MPKQRGLMIQTKDKSLETLIHDAISERDGRLNAEHHATDLQQIDTVLPIISKDLLNNSLNALSTSWELKLGNSQGSNILKTKIKRLMLYLVNWIYAPAVRQQNENNLHIVRTLDILSTMVMAQNKITQKSINSKPYIITNLSDMSATSSLDKVLLAFRYIQLYLDPTIQMLCIVRKIADTLYHDYIINIMQELGIKNVQLFYNPEPSAFNNYLSLSSTILTLSTDDGLHELYPEISMIASPVIIGSQSIFDSLGPNTILCQNASTAQMALLVNEICSNKKIREILTQ